MQDQSLDPAAPAPAPAENEPAPKRNPKPARTLASKAPRKRQSATASKKAAPAVKSGSTPKTRRQAVSRFVVLFRHGVAEERTGSKPDGDRSLTEEGHKKTRRAARGLRQLFSEADALFSSPLIRAMQTALWVTKAYGESLKVQVTDTLLPMADPAELAELIASQDGRNVIAVGHEPHMTEALAHLVGAKSSFAADLKKAGCVGIRLDEGGRGTLEWMLTPGMLRKLG